MLCSSVCVNVSLGPQINTFDFQGLGVYRIFHNIIGLLGLRNSEKCSKKKPCNQMLDLLIAALRHCFHAV